MDSASVLRFQEEVRPYLKMLREASLTIIDQDVSKHPIFVFHTDGVELLIKHNAFRYIGTFKTVNRAAQFRVFVVQGEAERHAGHPALDMHVELAQ